MSRCPRQGRRQRVGSVATGLLAAVLTLAVLICISLATALDSPGDPPPTLQQQQQRQQQQEQQQQQQQEQPQGHRIAAAEGDVDDLAPAVVLVGLGDDEPAVAAADGPGPAAPGEPLPELVHQAAGVFSPSTEAAAAFPSDLDTSDAGSSMYSGADGSSDSSRGRIEGEEEERETQAATPSVAADSGLSDSGEVPDQHGGVQATEEAGDGAEGAAAQPPASVEVVVVDTEAHDPVTPPAAGELPVPSDTPLETAGAAASAGESGDVPVTGAGDSDATPTSETREDDGPPAEAGAEGTAPEAFSNEEQLGEWELEEEGAEAEGEEESFTTASTPRSPPVPFRVEARQFAHADGGSSAEDQQLSRLVRFFEGANRAASRAELTDGYYAAMEALYVAGNLTRFVELAERAVAATGHSRLHFILGVLYTNGLGVERSEAKAVLHLSFAAIQGVPEAHAALATRHRSGRGVAMSCEAAAVHLRETADAVAMTFEGRLNIPPAGVGRELLAGAMGGSRSRISAPARDADRRIAQQEERHLTHLRIQADSNGAHAALELGKHYLYGYGGVPRNLATAEVYLLRAVRRPEMLMDVELNRAYALLGQVYCTAQSPISAEEGAATATAGGGRAGPQRSYKRALAYYRRAAAGGDGMGLNGIGYLHAIGFMHNNKTAEEQRAAAVADGDVAAEDLPGGSGELGAPDFEGAAAFFLRGAERTYTEAMYNLGVLYLHGRGVPLDLPKARSLFMSASAEGMVLANWQLGLLAEGSGDCARAVKFFSVVAAQGSWHAATADSGAGAGGVSPIMGGWRATTESAATPAAAEAAAAGGAGEEGEEVEYDAEVGGGGGAVVTQLRRAVAGAAAHLLPGLRVGGPRPPPAPAPAPTRAGMGGAVGERSPLARLVEQLALSETGSEPATRQAAVLLDEELHTVDEADTAATLAREGVVEVGSPIFARRNTLPAHVPVAAADGETVVVRWRVPALVRLPIGGPRAVAAVPWLLSQREAKALLLLRLLRAHAWRTADALHRLGDFFYAGESSWLGSDAAVALAYYTSAADLHDPHASFNAGVMYMLGIGVPPAPSATRRHNHNGSGSGAFASPASPDAPATPAERVWFAGLEPTEEHVAAAEAMLATAAPSYILEGIVRVMETATATRAGPGRRSWRYEPASGDGARAPVDLLGALHNRRPQPQGPFYWYDLNLAKRALDSCAGYTAAPRWAVAAVLAALNVQWWTLHYGRGVIAGVVARAAVALRYSGGGGGPLTLAVALLQGAVEELVSAVVGITVPYAPTAGSAGSAATTTTTAPSSGTAAAAAAGNDTSLSFTWQTFFSWCELLETVVLCVLVVTLFVLLLLQHHIQ